MSTTQQRAQTPATVVEDVAFMLANGEHPARIAARLGRTVYGLEQLLRRERRLDLAGPFYAERTWK